VFFLALLPIDLLLPRLNRLRRRLRIRSAQHARAVWAGSALFAAFHAQVWPSPVPLFVLALGLGYLYLRTRTLIGPVVVHGLFNAVSAVYLLLGGPA
jgi:membrane protease YdiL (CAAX protease family)